MFRIEFTPEAVEDLNFIWKFDQRQIVDALEKTLPHEPEKETRNRKRLRPNQVTEWELRIGTFRVFFDVDFDASVIKVFAIGYKKRNKLYIRDEDFEL